MFCGACALLMYPRSYALLENSMKGMGCVPSDQNWSDGAESASHPRTGFLVMDSMSGGQNWSARKPYLKQIFEATQVGDLRNESIAQLARRRLVSVRTELGCNIYYDRISAPTVCKVASSQLFPNLAYTYP